MKIGIIGAGQVGQALAKKLVKAGYHIIISNSKGPESLQSFTAQFGMLAEAGSSEQAAKADIVILAVGWLKIPEVLTNLGKFLKGKIVIDVSNFFPEQGQPWVLSQPTGVTVAALIPQSKVVKAFNHLYGKWIEAEPKLDNGKRVSFISGDDSDANKVVAEIITALGFKVIELGDLNQGGKLTDVGAPLSGLNLVGFPI
jgi:predicted dinucleotide-binding enzyme